MKRTLRLATLAIGLAAMGTAAAQNPPNAILQSKSPPQDSVPLQDQAPGPFSPAESPETPDTWIFSGVLSGQHEGFSGTLVAHKTEAEFELRLTNGATCDGAELTGEVGFVRLPEITCSDDRKMRALFVPQGHELLKVFGHVGDEKFATEAHLLGTEAPPEPKPALAPKGPLGLPPGPPDAGPDTKPKK
jgi:hypothetical protein